jgi:polyribonucleotide nucleotidyltransferase
MYAAGRIPGSFFRREGPAERGRRSLTCRLIDRPLRPSFVSGLRNEVQVVITVMALHPDHAVRRALPSTRRRCRPQLSGLPVQRPDRSDLASR